MSITWSNMTAAALGREIGAGRINPVELTEFFLDRIASHPLAPRIYARATATRARGEAMGAAARAKAGLRRGLLEDLERGARRGDQASMGPKGQESHHHRCLRTATDRKAGR